MVDEQVLSNEKENKQQKSRVLNRPPEVRPKNLTIGGRFSYGKI